LESPIGCLTVINPEFDSKKIYKYLTDLGFKSLDFLFPDNNYKLLPKYEISSYAKYLIDLFDVWVHENNSAISIRKLKSIMLQLIGKKPLIYGFGINTKKRIPILAVRSDGTIFPTDELMSTDYSVTQINKNVFTSTIEEVINAKVFEEIHQANLIPPERCLKCCWYNACGGGNIVSRFSEEKRFNNHSVYCEALKEIYAHIAAYMIKSGVPRKTITDNLFKS
jgi:uncharacterized protein